MHALKRATRTVCSRRTSHPSVTGTRRIHGLRPLPFDIEDGLGDFLSPSALRIVAVEYQQGLLDRLNEEVAGTELENLSVAQTVISSANSIHNVLAFNYASQALNNSFFFDNLLPPGQSPTPLVSSPDPSSEPPPSHEHTMSSHLLGLINTSFGSLSEMKSSLSAAALGMMSSGWVWLVCDENASHLAFVATYGPGTMLVRSRQHKYPEGLSPNLGPGPGGMSNVARRPFKILGEKLDPPTETSEPPSTRNAGAGSYQPLATKPFNRTPLSNPGTRAFHQATRASSPLSAALQHLGSNQSHARFSQLPLAWRTPLEPLSTGNQRPGTPHALQYSNVSSLGGEKEGAVGDSLSPTEEPEAEPEEQQLYTNDRPVYNSSIINSALHHRANSGWDVKRWRGHGDDLSPLMCISVHEHMWMAGGYGIWGKEEYLRRFWTVVNWAKVSRVLDLWASNSPSRLSNSSLSKPIRY